METTTAFLFCPRCGTRLQARSCHGRTRPACPACSFVQFSNPRVAVVVFLPQQDRILLVKRKFPPEQGAWARAAGFVDLGEPPEAAAVREVREETGLEVVVEGLLDLGYDEANQVIFILYRARAVGGTLAAADDVDEARWFGRDELPALAFQSTRKAVADWLAAGSCAGERLSGRPGSPS